ncbi:MAG: RluA family pseudouridine synthase [bacterium]|nr:RluA family pseudouridine synthase [bacterium]
MNKKLIYHSNNKERIDIYIKNRFNIPREKVKSLLKEGFILVTNKEVKPSYLLRNGDEILINEDVLNQYKEHEIIPEKHPIDIIYSDNEIIVVNKPAGIITHPTEKIRNGTMVNFLLNITTLSNKNSLRPGVVHRLDRETSGVMVFAKTDNAWENLVLQFKNRTVEKEYLAIVKGHFSPLKKEVEFTVSHNRDNYTKMKVHYLKGKKAVNIIEVIKYLGDLTLVKIKPLTGRTHQIRLALSHLGYPIIGDTKYGVRSDIIKRTALHSYRISFYHPSTKERCQFRADVPEDFLKIISEIDNKD